MPTKKTEIDPNASDETLAWIAEEEAESKETEKKIASGEIPQSAVAGWDSANWQEKASGAAPPDLDV